MNPVPVLITAVLITAVPTTAAQLPVTTAAAGSSLLLGLGFLLAVTLILATAALLRKKRRGAEFRTLRNYHRTLNNPLVSIIVSIDPDALSRSDLQEISAIGLELERSEQIVQGVLSGHESSASARQALDRRLIPLKRELTQLRDRSVSHTDPLALT